MFKFKFKCWMNIGSREGKRIQKILFIHTYLHSARAISHNSYLLLFLVFTRADHFYVLKKKKNQKRKTNRSSHNEWAIWKIFWTAAEPRAWLVIRLVRRRIMFCRNKKRIIFFLIDSVCLRKLKQIWLYLLQWVLNVLNNDAEFHFLMLMAIIMLMLWPVIFW